MPCLRKRKTGKTKRKKKTNNLASPFFWVHHFFGQRRLRLRAPSFRVLHRLDISAMEENESSASNANVYVVSDAKGSSV
jgi:hypothetical protein